MFQHSFPSQCSCVGDSALGHDRCVLGSWKRVSSVICMSARSIVTSVLWFCVFLPISLLVMISGCLCKFTWWLIYSCADLCWLLWTRLYSSVVRAVDCRSAGPWFNSSWKSWFTFMTWSSNQIIQMINIMSPITTSIRTITRNSVKMVAEPDNDTAQWIFMQHDRRAANCSSLSQYRSSSTFHGRAAKFSRGVHDGPAS